MSVNETQSKKRYLNIVVMFIVVVIMVLLDFIWLAFVSKTHYQQMIYKIQHEKLVIRWSSAIISYIILIIGFFVFVYPKCINNTNSKLQAILYGALYGLVVYGVYNTTNYATLAKYTIQDVLIDTIWGCVLFAILALCSSYLHSAIVK